MAEYQREAEAALGVEVNTAYAGDIESDSVGRLLNLLRGDAYPPLDDLVREAEIIVLITYPELSYDGEEGDIDADSLNCWREASTQTPEPPAPTTDEYWAPYTTLLDDIYTEIWALREIHTDSVDRTRPTQSLHRPSTQRATSKLNVACGARRGAPSCATQPNVMEPSM